MNIKSYKNINKYIIFLCLGVMAILFLMPMILTISSSFMTDKEITYNYSAMLNPGSDKENVSDTISLKLIPDSMTLQQYSESMTDYNFLKRFLNSIILTVPITILQIVISLLAAYGFAFYKGKLKKITFFIYIILMLMPYQVLLVPNYLVGNLLDITGSRWMLILPGIFSVFPVYLFTRTMRKIPISYFEAAKIDGANGFQIFRFIVIPLCKSIIVSVLLLVFINYWNMVEQPLLFIDDPDKQPLSMFLTATNKQNLGQTFAAAVLYMIPPLLLFILGRKDLAKGISYSGIKD